MSFFLFAGPGPDILRSNVRKSSAGHKNYSVPSCPPKSTRPKMYHIRCPQLLLLLLFRTHISVCVCAQHFNPACSFELIENVQTSRRGPAQIQGTNPPQSTPEQDYTPRHSDHHASSCDQKWKCWKDPHDATSSIPVDDIEPLTQRGVQEFSVQSNSYPPGSRTTNPVNLLSSTINNSLPHSTNMSSNQINNMTRNWQPPSGVLQAKRAAQ